jgi:hypothetical protein
MTILALIQRLPKTLEQNSFNLNLFRYNDGSIYSLWLFLSF